MKRIILTVICACIIFMAVGCDMLSTDGENGQGSENESITGETVTSKSEANADGSNGSDSAKESVSDEETTADQEKNENPAPDFTVTDVDGNKVKLSSFFGKPIILNFWASGCGPCRNEMPDFQAAYEKYGDDVTFIMVNYIGFFGETVDSAKNFVDAQGYTFPIYFDTDNSAAATYGIYSIPQTFFIDENGELVAYAEGMIGSASLETGIGMILN